MIIWLDGALMPIGEARISPLDHGLVVGDGVFETLRVYDGVPFAWRRHYERLAVSAAGLGLDIPASEVLRHAADAVLDANALREARVRVTVTGGPAPPGSSRGGAVPTAFVVATAVDAPAARADVVVVPWSRNERGACAGLKTISYAENVRALAFAEARGAHEAMFLNTRDELCEATGSNVFVVRDGVARTPPATSGCLLGVTRALLIVASESCDVAVEEATLSLADLRDADEAFLSSTVREVQPIATVDGVPLRSAPGPVSERLAAAFTELRRHDLDP
ncbi:MAG: branched-chain amino acid aminotransferase/4-amino-4-deoxychorismate lyase [Actinomycetia bacterium]|nr:branched-chain amino acid aminotransferase/4-amino-4-deoxychorismate lyase [Actinomycetes bacterium]